MIENYLWFDYEKIKIGFTEKDRDFVKVTFYGLKEAIKFLSNYFNLDKDFPPVRAILAPNREEYIRLVKEFLRVDTEEASKPSRIAQPQRTDLVLLAPSAYSTDSIYKYSVEEYKRLIFHEVIHIFEEYLSPNIELTPRWWSEGLATYLSEQWKYEDDVRIPVINGCKIKRVPDFNEVEKDVILSYQ